jgi:methyl-accepting chemotaxis protein
VNNSIKTIIDLSKKIYKSTQTIDMSTNEQKIAHEEATSTITYISESAMGLNSVINRVAETAQTINGLSDDLSGLIDQMVLADA